MLFQHPQHIPVSVGLLPATWMKYRQELDALVRRHPVVFGEDQPAERDYDAIWRETYRAGEHVDAWGCVWRNLRTGMEAMVTGHPVPTREAVHALKAPVEDIGLPHGFMYLRLGDLRGFEEVMIDFAEEPPELQMLIDIVLQYNLRQLDKLLAERTAPQILYFGDDLGMQTGPQFSPRMFKEFFQPRYTLLWGTAKKLADVKVMLHCCGGIYPLLPGLIEAGLDIIQPVQTNARDMEPERLKQEFGRDICLWGGGCDTQHVLPRGTPEEVTENVRRNVSVLAPGGGFVFQQIHNVMADVPPENIVAMLEAAIHNKTPTFEGDG